MNAPDDGAALVPQPAIPSRDECPGAHLDPQTYEYTLQSGLVETRRTRTFPRHYWVWKHEPRPFASQVCATCGAVK